MSARVQLPARRGFSLVEVILAVGIFATAVTVVLALLPALTRQAAVSTDTLAAERLADALPVELARLAEGGFDLLAQQIPEVQTPLNAGFPCIATQDASRLQSRDYLAPSLGVVGEDEHYFLVECWRFADGPFRFENSRAVLALQVRVSWPYRLPGASGPTDPAERSQITFATAINR